jgi:ribosomal protein S18 acetylase RimI-like enzyme
MENFLRAKEAEMLRTALMDKNWMDICRIDVDFLHEGEYMGSATIEITDENSVMIWDVEIDENHRGKGLGTVMMTEIIEFIYRNILLTRVVELFVSKKNTGAIVCYTRVGFRVVSSSNGFNCQLMQYAGEIH